MWCSAAQTNNPALPYAPVDRDQEFDSELLQKINLILQLCLDLLIWVGYVIQYAAHHLMTIGPFTADRVFGPNGNIVCKSANFGKFEDFSHYIYYRRHPVSFSKATLDIVSKHGLSATKNEFSPEPFDKGHCFGNVLVALKTWLETENEDDLINACKGGSSLEGTVYQAAYEGDLYDPLYYPQLVTLIQDLLATYHETTYKAEEKRWRDAKFEKGICILQAIWDYLEGGGNPEKNGDFLEAISAKVKLGGPALATIREVAQGYSHHNLAERARMRAIFETAGMKIKKFHHMDSSARKVLTTIGKLKRGSYKLSFPTYNSCGTRRGSHVVAIIIGPTACYILDNNVALGSCSRDELQATVGRIFTEYNGMDYSRKLQGERPSIWGRIGNVFRERANPPDKPLSKGYDLFSVTAC